MRLASLRLSAGSSQAHPPNTIEKATLTLANCIKLNLLFIVLSL